MLHHYLTIGWRNLRRNPLYGLINVVGLAIGVATCILIFLFVQDEITYDSFHQNVDRIVRLVRYPTVEGAKFELNRRPTPFVPMPMGPAAASDIPGVEAMTRIIHADEVTVSVNGQQFGETADFADNSLFSLFSFPLRQGQSNSALASPNAVVLSRKLAQKYFGDADAMGRTLDISVYGNPPQAYQVSGILDDYPANSTVSLDLLLPIASSFRYDLAMTRWSWWRAPTFLLLRPGVTSESIAEPLAKLYASHQEASSQDEANPQVPYFRFVAQPLREIHFDYETGGSRPLYSYVLSGIAIAVLFIACVNFITLAMARSMTRAREISVRKVFGAVRSQVVSQFWGESLILALASVVAGIALAEVLLPTFSTLSGKSLTLNPLANLPLLALVVGLLIFLAIAAGSVPAFFLARLQPALVFARHARLSKSSPLAKALIVLQFAFSITLIICMWGMHQQQSYIRTRPLGFDAEQVVVVSNTMPRSADSHATLEKLRQLLSGNDRITSVAAMSSSFARGWDQWEWRDGDRQVRTFVFNVEPQLLSTLGFQLAEGRNFSLDYPSDSLYSILINESMVRSLGLTDPIGKPLPGFKFDDTLTPPLIVGVVKDFHILSLHEAIAPALFHMSSSDPFGFFMIRVKNTDLHAAVVDIEAAWKQVANDSRFDYSFLDDDIAKQYVAEERWFNIVSYSTLLAIIIASLGLFGLAGVTALRRMKEVSIRKVLGASLPELFQTLNWEFVFVVGIANLVAWPLAFVILNQWLQSFVYRTELSVWIFLCSGLAALGIALSVVSVHTLRAASVNPAEILRHE